MIPNSPRKFEQYFYSCNFAIFYANLKKNPKTCWKIFQSRRPFLHSTFFLSSSFFWWCGIQFIVRFVILLLVICCTWQILVSYPPFSSVVEYLPFLLFELLEFSEIFLEHLFPLPRIFLYFSPLIDKFLIQTADYYWSWYCRYYTFDVLLYVCSIGSDCFLYRFFSPLFPYYLCRYCQLLFLDPSTINVLFIVHWCRFRY